VLRFAGYPVTCEFYVNDAGNQVQMLSLSVWARYMEAAREADPSVPAVEFPENGYKGGYIRDFGRELLAAEGKRWIAPEPPADIAAIRQFAIDRSLGLIRATLQRFDVTFDVWQSERALHEAGDVNETLRALDAAGYIDRHDDAVWLKTTALWGDDKDRVVVKSDGLPTYLLADIAYHRKKLARGFQELLDIWGADHHGHIARMRAALKAFGESPDVLKVILIQTVSLLRDGQEVKMGKRAGEFVTLDDVVDEVGRDATRYFYLMRRHDTPLEFDLELAKRQSMDNPVYYVQYAHARCCAILRRARELEAPAHAAGRGDRDPEAPRRLPGFRGRRGGGARAAPGDDVPARTGWRLPELLHPPAEGARRPDPAAGTATHGRVARHLGLAEDRGAPQLDRGDRAGDAQRPGAAGRVGARDDGPRPGPRSGGRGGGPRSERRS
jgi:arginyl-tRNA synthetase